MKKNNYHSPDFDSIEESYQAGRIDLDIEIKQNQIERYINIPNVNFKSISMVADSQMFKWWVETINYRNRFYESVIYLEF